MKIVGCSLVLAAAAASCHAFLPAPGMARVASSSSSRSSRDALATRRPSVRLPTPPEVLEQAPQQSLLQDGEQQPPSQSPRALAAAGVDVVEGAVARPKKGKGPVPVVVVDDDSLETTSEHR